ncbi:hypothetical protein AAKU55_004238 [Oxalobacteraceae bacterium GrIS 1.11]
MQLDGKLVVAAILLAAAAVGNACAVPIILSAPQEHHAYANNARDGTALLAQANNSDFQARHYQSLADFKLRAVDARDAANAYGKAPAEPTPLPSPYIMLLLGAGVMVLAGGKQQKAPPWSASPEA